ncbi:MAG: D-alanyl-D-alanine carboxypeptidase/D-alanyl-D-alanine-endopeptidase [Gemmatales bacterium]|nr:D-alanyl-D-alanine carboxypeptidase/D-alanyl-D-alanine-endopeptidase [Gemmatales bacterium]MDW8387293.1 D-alanyl-D-alanine carboxypeptidase/D-alanyl-D-alanine-endopeptidase [Gemmatales bacterium]
MVQRTGAMVLGSGLAVVLAVFLAMTGLLEIKVSGKASAQSVEIRSAAEKLAADIEAVLKQPRYKQAHWGILAVDLESGKTLYELNPDKLFIPASTTKLFSCACALDAFGPDYRFETPVVRKGEVSSDGTLRGDLILIASGDLTLGGRTLPDGRIAFVNVDHTYANGFANADWTEPDPLAGLNDLARQVAASGIRKITGRILIDDRLFEHAESTGSGPIRVTPIMVNDNLYDVRITPTQPGEPARIETRPQSPLVALDAQVTTAKKGEPLRITLTALPGNRFVVRGQIPEDSKPQLRVFEVEDPASFARGLFIEALKRAGVEVEASPLVGNTPRDLPSREETLKLPRVAVLTSPPFRENIKLILKVSHNLHASTLPILVAVKHGKRTLDEGLHLQREFLAKAGVEVDTISFGGGAGGSRADAVTPRAAVQLLRYMATRPDFPVYFEALPRLGVDGTLAPAVKEDSPARDKAQAKTGTLLWRNTMNDRFLLTSKALAGYLTTRSGRKLVFAMFVNNTHLEKANDSRIEGEALGRLCEVLYEAE